MVIKRTSPFGQTLTRLLVSIDALIILLTVQACQNTATPLPVVALASPVPAVLPAPTLPPVVISTPLEALIEGIQANETPLIPPPPASPMVEVENPFVIGYSVQTNPIRVYRFGAGDQILLLIGGIHGGWEANTVELVEQLIHHFSTTPADILPGITIHLIPAANPDGLALGTGRNARYNGHAVDLNRNWACEWSSEAYWRDQRVFAGSAPMSEPETQSIAAYVLEMQPEVVLFYHSQAAGVFAGDCEGRGVSGEMSAVYGEAAGYTYGAAFSAYPVTGTAASWVDSLGIPSADVELETHDDPEFARNLQAIMALQAWILES